MESELSNGVFVYAHFAKRRIKCYLLTRIKILDLKFPENFDIFTSGL